MVAEVGEVAAAVAEEFVVVVVVIVVFVVVEVVGVAVVVVVVLLLLDFGGAGWQACLLDEGMAGCLPCWALTLAYPSKFL